MGCRKVGYCCYMSRHIDYAFKSYVLNKHSELLDRYRKCSLHDYAYKRFEELGEITPVLRMDKKYNESIDDLWWYVCENGLVSEYYEVKKINHAQYERVKRLKERVKTLLLGGECLFVTLTFNPVSLQNTTAKERRIAVSRYLKTFNAKYVANIDFGKQNHREHYHALIQCSRIDLKGWRNMGNINVERIRLSAKNDDYIKLSKYIAKLTNHAIKETTKRSALIYSRS